MNLADEEETVMRADISIHRNIGMTIYLATLETRTWKKKKKLTIYFNNYKRILLNGLRRQFGLDISKHKSQGMTLYLATLEPLTRLLDV